MLTGNIVATTRETNKAPTPAGNRGFVASPGADTLPTRDGHISLGANTFAQFRSLCRILGRPELAEPPHLPEGLPDGAFLTNMSSDALRAELFLATSQFTSLELERNLMEAGVPASKVRDIHQFLTELYPTTPGIDLPESDGILGAGFRWLGETPQKLRPAPRLGQDTASVVK